MDYIAETRKPNFWIQDYGNAWLGPSLALKFVEDDASEENIKELRVGNVDSFEEFVSAPKREYDGQRCDIDLIPQNFIDINDTLVRMYNKLLEKSEVDFVRLRRIVDLAHKVVYRGWN